MSAARAIHQIVNGTGTETDTGKVVVAGSADKDVEKINLLLDVTALAGTAPTLDVALEWTFDDGTTYVAPSTPVTFTQVTAGGGKQIVSADVLAPAYRLAYTWGGTVTDADLVIYEDTR